MAQRRPDPMKAANKRWPTNPKYRNVKPVVDSGATLRKYLEGIEERHRDFKYNNDEVFRRIKLNTFIRLVIEVWRDEIQKESEEVCDVLESPKVPTTDIKEDVQQGLTDRISTSRSTLHGLISGVGELDLWLPQTKRSDFKLERPYLLLDVRNPDDYAQWHIVSAINYPHTMLARVMNYESKELLTYKNKPGLIIVVYDEDETLSQKVATTLVQRGYDNMYLLSGGMNLAWRRFSDGLVVGSPPKNHAAIIEPPKTYRTGKPSVVRILDSFSLADLDRLERNINTNFVSTTLSGGRSALSTTRRKNDISEDATSTSKNGMQSPIRHKPWK